MNPLTPIVQYLFNTPNLEQVTIEALLQQTAKHPYFSVGQLLLLKKMQAENHASLKDQTATSLMHFNNPMWLYWWMHQHENHSIFQIKEESIHAEAHDAILPKEMVISNSMDTKAETENPSNESIENGESVLQNALVPSLKGISAEDLAILSGKKKSENFIQPADETLAFEPFHTIDYFASQGIKLSHKMEPNDKLGRQLKSFTEWLKTMQKLPATVENTGLDDATSIQIDVMAQDSLKGKDILTESMAEVLAKQGMTEKAIEIYTKLSLLNPSKSHYFATKIEDLK